MNYQDDIHSICLVEHTLEMANDQRFDKAILDEEAVMAMARMPWTLRLRKSDHGCALFRITCDRVSRRV